MHRFACNLGGVLIVLSAAFAPFVAAGGALSILFPSWWASADGGDRLWWMWAIAGPMLVLELLAVIDHFGTDGRGR